MHLVLTSNSCRDSFRDEEREQRLAQASAVTKREMADQNAAEVEFIRQFILAENGTRRWPPTAASSVKLISRLALAARRNPPRNSHTTNLAPPS